MEDIMNDDIGTPPEQSRQVNESNMDSSEQNTMSSVSDSDQGRSEPAAGIQGLGKKYMGDINSCSIFLFNSNNYWGPVASLTLLPINLADVPGFMESVPGFLQSGNKGRGIIGLDVERMMKQFYSESSAIVPYEWEGDKKSKRSDGRGFLALFAVPDDDSQPGTIESILGSTLLNLYEREKFIPSDVAVLLTPLFKRKEKEKVTSLLNSLPEQLANIPGSDAKRNITFITAEQTFYNGVFNFFNQKPSPFEADVISDDDRLNLENEAFALADILSLREMKPPISVAIMGGWGSGKSSVMRLIQKRVRGIRSKGRTEQQTWEDKNEEKSAAKLSPFVGHIYQIELNAWDYAKSNLWASLMYKIFYCLNDQMAKERMIADFLVQNDTHDPKKSKPGFLMESQLWEAISFNEKDLKILLSDPNNSGLKKYLEKIHSNEKVRDYLWKSLEKSRFEIQKDLNETRNLINSTRITLSERREEIEQEVEMKFSEFSRRSILMSPLKAKFFSLLGNFGNALFANISTLSSSAKSSEEIDLEKLFHIPAKNKLQLNRNEILGFVIFSALCIAFPFVTQQEKTDIPAFLVGGLSIFSGYLRTISKSKKLILTCLDEYHAQLDKVKAELKDEKERFREVAYEQNRLKEDQNAANDEDSNTLGNLEKKLAKYLAKEKQERELVGITADYETLTDFLHSRLGEDGYEKQLGLMHQVKRDLEYLTEGLRDNKLIFPRGPARIMLYIDDLDRCPPQRVVEVFEATQLLLRTDLFIVVLAIDVRYIVKALEKYYDKILVRGGRPSALDYIEKIVQIPYRIRSIDPDTMGKYLKWQMPVEKSEGSAEPGLVPPEEVKVPGMATGIESKDQSVIKPELMDFPEKEIKFTREEIAAWELCCTKVPDLTPREIKRLVNVAKILKLIWFREGSTPDKEVKDVTFLLLALSERFPDLMRDILNEMADHLNLKSESRLLIQFFNDFKPKKLTIYLESELMSLKQIINLPDLIPQNFELNRLKNKSLDQVRSFCFVGDVGYDPEDENTGSQKSNADNSFKGIH